MAELKDYSGPYKHDLRFEDFSKDFLIKLMPLWQKAYTRLNAFWFQAVTERFGEEAAQSCNREVWLKVGEKIVPKFAKIGNIKPKTVLDAVKISQLVPENLGSDLFESQMDVKNKNHVVATITRCAVLEFFEGTAPEKLKYWCHELEKPVLERYLNHPDNPHIKVTPLKLPPRKSPDEICCQFEFKLEE